MPTEKLLVVCQYTGEAFTLLLIRPFGLPSKTFQPDRDRAGWASYPFSPRFSSWKSPRTENFPRRL